LALFACLNDLLDLVGHAGPVIELPAGLAHFDNATMADVNRL
jgi:hypothetical protein